jgi:hypothetical protein
MLYLALSVHCRYSLPFSSLDSFLLALHPPPPDPALLNSKSKEANKESNPDEVFFKISGDAHASQPLPASLIETYTVEHAACA